MIGWTWIALGKNQNKDKCAGDLIVGLFRIDSMNLYIIDIIYIKSISSWKTPQIAENLYILQMADK